MKKIYFSARSLCRSQCNAVVLSIALLCAPQILFADNSKVTVSSEMWARVNSTGKFIKITGLKKLVEELNSNEAVVLDINYAGGEAGQLWAQQFQNRLIALGIDSSRIYLVQGAAATNRLEIGSRMLP